MDAPEQMQRLIVGHRMTQAVHVAAVLGLSDLLAGDPVGVDRLAVATDCDPRSLHRLLRALASIEVYRELPDGRYTSTPLGDQLRSDSVGNRRAVAVFEGRPYNWQPWSALLHNVRTGQNAFTAVHGRGSWEYRADHPDESTIFDAAMTSISDRVSGAILQAFDFGRFSTVVDVAGGRGALLAAILARYPTLRGVLFDQPHVIAGAHLAGVEDRCEIVGGDMFVEVPAGGEGYLMKAILHDWEDPQARAILQACRRVMPDSGALVVVERLLDSADQNVTFADLNMMVGPGGRERTTDEYAELFAAAGFLLTRTVPTTTDWVVIEAVPTE